MSEYKNDKPPKEVWLQFYEDPTLPDSEKEVAHPEDRSWSSGKIFRDDVKYVDAAALEAAEGKIKKLAGFIKILVSSANELIRNQ